MTLTNKSTMLLSTLSILPLKATVDIDESDIDRRSLQYTVRSIMVEGIKKEIKSMSSYWVKRVINMGLGLLGLQWAQRITKIVLSKSSSTWVLLPPLPSLPLSFSFSKVFLQMSFEWLRVLKIWRCKFTISWK